VLARLGKIQNRNISPLLSLESGKIFVKIRDRLPKKEHLFPGEQQLLFVPFKFDRVSNKPQREAAFQRPSLEYHPFYDSLKRGQHGSSHTKKPKNILRLLYRF
jgi:hypothetical protein